MEKAILIVVIHLFFRNIFIFKKKKGQTIQSQEWIEELEEISNILKEFLNIDFDRYNIFFFNNKN